MSAPLPPRPKIRNARTQALTRRETMWQIGVPLGVAMALTLAAMVWLVVGASYPTLSAVADVSLLLLICPVILAGVVALVLLSGLVFGMHYALRELPYLFKKAQDGMALVTQYTKRYAGQVAGVFLSTRASLAAAQKTADHLRHALDWRRTK
jgi:hypothetical protein